MCIYVFLGLIFPAGSNTATAKRSQFRRTKSVVETTTGYQQPEENGVKRQNACKSSSTPTLGSQSEPTKATFRIGSSEEVSNSVEGKDPDATSPMEDVPESDSDTGDEQVRCRTPLLARHSSLEQKYSNPSVENSNRKVEGGGPGQTQAKRVSFSTRSLDGSQHYYRPHHKGRSKQYDISKDRDNRVVEKDKRRKHGTSEERRHAYLRSESAVEVGEGVAGDAAFGVPTSASSNNVEETSLTEKRFALVPQNDSMVGWNLPGGPFSSQWMFQAVNVSVKPLDGSAECLGTLLFSKSSMVKFFEI